MKQINWGFIGCGEVTEKKSGPAFNEIEGSRVVAVMSRSEKKARSYAEKHHISKWYTDAQELVDDPDVNAIYIATPPSSHATFAIMAMYAGKPVYIEKPLAASYDDCARINRVSEQTGMPCFVAYYRRSLPYFQRVKEIVSDGKIGKIINVQIRFSCPPRDLDYNSAALPWRVQPDIAGGGYFYDLAPHQLDLLQEMFGVIIEANGMCANRRWTVSGGGQRKRMFQVRERPAGQRLVVFRRSSVCQGRPDRDNRRQGLAEIFCFHIRADNTHHKRGNDKTYHPKSSVCAVADD